MPNKTNLTRCLVMTVLLAFVSFATAADIKISEIYYDTPDDLENEFIELYVWDDDGCDVNLTNWYIDDYDGNIEFLPDIYDLRNFTYISIRMGSGTDDLDASDGNATIYLDRPPMLDSGDEVGLYDGGDQLVDFVRYDGGNGDPVLGGWPSSDYGASAYSIGQSIQLIGYDYNNSDNWLSLPISERAEPPIPTTIFVDPNAEGANNGTSWGDAFKYLQDALVIAAASGGGITEIWVADGIYNPDVNSNDPNGSGDREATFQLINGVALYGGYAGYGATDPNARDVELYETILSGDLDGNDTPGLDPCDLPSDPNRGENSYHVVTGSGTDATAVLDGFTITAGHADGSDANGNGGGMYNYNYSTTMVTNCVFRANCAHGAGGGMCNYINSSPTVTNSMFSGNSAGDYAGGGMYNYYYSNPTVTNSTFSGNSAGDYAGGGMYNYYYSSPTVTNSTFSGNSAGDYGAGGMYNYYYSNPTVTNSTFSGNSAGDYAGGMYNYYSSDPNVINCSFSRNSANAGGGIYNWEDSDPTVTNCILWGNSDLGGEDESAQIHGGIPVVSYSCIEGLDALAGSGNIGDDPLFLDPNGPDNVPGTQDDNLRLSYDSPCIDASDNLSVPNDVADLDGDGNTAEPIPWDMDNHPRIADGDCNDSNVVDMGLYEFAWAYIGDFDGQCDVDFGDYAIFALAWLTEQGHGQYNPDCDISLPADGVIDWRDLDILTDHWLAAK